MVAVRRTTTRWRRWFAKSRSHTRTCPPLKGPGTTLAFECVSGPESRATGLITSTCRSCWPAKSMCGIPRCSSFTSPLRTAGCDWLAPTTWCSRTPGTRRTQAPELMGQKFQQFEAPNVRAAAVLYAPLWDWKENPRHIRQRHSRLSARVLRSTPSPARARRRLTFVDFIGESWGTHRSTKQGGHALVTGVTLVMAATAALIATAWASPATPGRVGDCGGPSFRPRRLHCKGGKGRWASATAGAARRSASTATDDPVRRAGYGKAFED